MIYTKLMSAEFNRFATYVSENAKTLVQLKTVAWAVSSDRKRQPSLIAVQRKRHALDNLDDLAHVVCLERKSLNFFLNENVVHRYFFYPFFFYCYSVASFVLEPHLVRASLRFPSLNRLWCFAFLACPAWSKKKRKNREQSCQLKGDR